MDKSQEDDPVLLDRHTQGMRSELGRASLMDLMVCAAELGLAIFSSPCPMDIFWPENREEHKDLFCFGITSTNIVPGTYNDVHHGMVHRQLLLRPYDKLCEDWRIKERAVSLAEWELKAAKWAKKDQNFKRHHKLREQLLVDRKALARTRGASAAGKKSDEVEVAAAEAEAKRVAAEAEAEAEAERRKVSEEKRRKWGEEWERKERARQERFREEDPGVEGSGTGSAGAWPRGGVG